MKRITRRATTIALATAAITTGMVSAASANAPGGNETCPSNAFCVYYNSWQYGWGAFAVYPGDLLLSEDLSGYPRDLFANKGNGSGYNDEVYHNVAAVVNNSSLTWTLCTDNQNWCEDYAPGEAGNVSPSIHNEDGWISS